MSEHKATIKWERHGADFGYKNYSRDHVFTFGVMRFHRMRYRQPRDPAQRQMFENSQVRTRGFLLSRPAPCREHAKA